MGAVSLTTMVKVLIWRIVNNCAKMWDLGLTVSVFLGNGWNPEKKPVSPSIGTHGLSNADSTAE